MLEMRPNCECCDKDLDPSGVEARICSFECTFCADCAEQTLKGKCPNCGGGFSLRPIRPARNWKGDNFLGKYPASSTVKHRPVDPAAHARFADLPKTVPPEKR